MIVLDNNTPIAGKALSHYQVIRRDGVVTSFELNRIAEATLKAFLAVRGTLNGRHRFMLRSSGLLSSAVEHTWVWLCKIWSPALQRNHAVLFSENHIARNAGAVKPPFSSKKQGFFSALKPNLRNAP